MKKHVLNLKLPKILLLMGAPFSGSGEDSIISREIVLHTPTGGVVEIIHGHDLPLPAGLENISFVFNNNFGVAQKYSAVLLINQEKMTQENITVALNDVIKWYTRYAKEYDFVISKQDPDYESCFE